MLPLKIADLYIVETLDTNRSHERLWFYWNMINRSPGWHFIQTGIFGPGLLFFHGSGLFFAGQRMLVTSRLPFVKGGRICRHRNFCTTHCTLKRGKVGLCLAANVCQHVIQKHYHPTTAAPAPQNDSIVLLCKVGPPRFPHFPLKVNVQIQQSALIKILK